jgi:hypothetical protein
VFPIAKKDDVLAVEHVKRFGAIVVNVHGRAESRRLVGFEQGEGSGCLFARRLDGHPETAEIDRTVARWKNERRSGLLAVAPRLRSIWVRGHPSLHSSA